MVRLIFALPMEQDHRICLVPRHMNLPVNYLTVRRVRIRSSNLITRLESLIHA